MANSIRRTTLRGPTREEIIALNKTNGNISPTRNNNTSIENDLVGKMYSLELQCFALDQEVSTIGYFNYWLYQSGVLIDEYCMYPGNWNDLNLPCPPKVSDVYKLCQVFRVEEKVKEIENILRYWKVEYYMAMERVKEKYMGIAISNIPYQIALDRINGRIEDTNGFEETNEMKKLIEIRDILNLNWKLGYIHESPPDLLDQANKLWDTLQISE